MRYWKRVNKEGTATTVESCSHDLQVAGAVEITEKEFNDFIASLPIEDPMRSPVSVDEELQDIKQRIANLEARISGR